MLFKKFFIPVNLLHLIFYLSGCNFINISKDEYEALSKIIRTPQNMDPLISSGEWVFEGLRTDQQWAIIPSPTGHKLRLNSGSLPFILGRKTNANILLTPYLTWEWKLEKGKWNQYPVHIFIALNSEEKSPKYRSQISNFFSKTNLPPHDKRIFIIWGQSDLIKGSLIHRKIKNKQRNEVYYTIRGGKQNLGQWHSEAIDIATLYQQAWPASRYQNVKVVFLGIAITESNFLQTSYVKNLRLSQ